MSISFSLTFTIYNEKTFASYMPSSWYKMLWRFMSNLLFKLNITKDYNDLPILHKKDVYLMQAFNVGGFRNAELISLNFVRKSIREVTLANIATSAKNCISLQSYNAVEK